jgi:hypothetical protein
MKQTIEIPASSGARLWSQTRPPHGGFFARAVAGALQPRTEGRGSFGIRRVSSALLMTFVFMAAFDVRAETVSILLDSNVSARVEYGADQLSRAITDAGLNLMTESRTGTDKPDHRIIIAHPDLPSVQKLVSTGLLKLDLGKLAKEGYVIGAWNHGKIVAVVGADDSGLLYGCLELARRIRESHKLPDDVQMIDAPAMTLRGTCVGMQKTFILPGRKVYEYPYTPELFPWFYDKKLWTEYLDFLAANRMNTLYLWSGHPFASLVRLKDYPYAVEVPDDVFQKNQEQFRWLAQECDKRGIWLVQMFYNIFVSKPFAETNHISTQLSAPTPLVADYTRKSIAEFVKEFPNVGLMVCLGEALQGTSNQVEWATQTILPGVLDGMKAAGLKEQPPVVIRTHAMNPEAIMPACFQVYSNLFTETKYNGESLTTWEPRGKGQATHQAMAKLGPHLVNIHILSNLEPFRYGATEFIRKSVLASRDRLGASGIHLYPLSYWNWPYSPDIADPPLLQWDRDWIWFEAWARYAWNPAVNTNEDRAYWIGRLAGFYGCDAGTAGKILDAYNDAGEVAPMLIRRFGITEGNRQTLSLGMTLDQLVNPMKYGAIEDLWLSQAPPGERLDEFVRKEWNHKPHVGETPGTIERQAWDFSSSAVENIDAAAPFVKLNQREFSRLRDDIYSIRLMGCFYAAKAKAATHVLRYGYSQDIADMEKAQKWLGDSLEAFELLTALTQTNYHFANSMQTSQRKIPVRGGENGVGTNYLWSQLLPLYRKELDDFQARLSELKQGTNASVIVEENQIKSWPTAKFKLISTNAETYEVKTGARVFTDRKYVIEKLAPELNGLTGIRFSHEAAKNGHYEPVEIELSEPSQVLVGYFNDTRDIWLQVPKLEFAAQADERGGVDTVLENAATIQECPDVNLHAFRYEAGRQKLEFIGKGSFVILGVVPQSVKLK